MELELRGKTALITGGSRGIGLAMAARFAEAGANVMITSRKADALAHAAAGLVAAGASEERVAWTAAHVGKPEDAESCVAETVARFGRLDILVNNAGLMANKPLAEVTEEEYDRLFAVNVKGVFFACQQAARRMADGGRIINFSTSTTVRGLMLPTYGAYVASKGAIEPFTQVLAKELGSRDITVNVISPGPVDTELFSQGKTEEDKRRFGQMAALGRLGEPEDIADVVAFLASNEARWITGQNIRVNGGMN
jgi:3-oxoacyl-[acyl-carrier protein] reductase